MLSAGIQNVTKGKSMINNQKGGILSKIFMIPVGVALMVGFFFLGYYMGKYQNKSSASGEIAQPLPEVSSGTGTKKEEFTFYKTLTNNTDKTVSIDLKAKPTKEEKKPEKQQAAPKEKRIDIKVEKEASSPVKPKQADSNQPQISAKKESAKASTGVKLRYTLQTASYQEKEMAEDEVRRLKQRGYAAFIYSSQLPGKGIWYRVRLGSFSNRSAAEKLQATVHAKEGISPIITIE
jgi:cell division septation protein DedD